MFCSNCGTRLPDDAKFCSNCGAPLKQDFKINDKSSEPRWETCEILCHDILKRAGLMFGSATIRFSAEAVGKDGRYDAGYSEGFQLAKQYYMLGINFIPPNFLPPANDPNVVNALDTLVKELTHDGWESTGRGQSWFSHKFRRRIK